MISFSYYTSTVNVICVCLPRPVEWSLLFVTILVSSFPLPRRERDTAGTEVQFYQEGYLLCLWLNVSSCFNLQNRRQLLTNPDLTRGELVLFQRSLVSPKFWSISFFISLKDVPFLVISLICLHWHYQLRTKLELNWAGWWHCCLL